MAARVRPGRVVALPPSSSTKSVLTSTCLLLSGNVFFTSVAPHIRDLSPAQARWPDNSWEKPVGSPGRLGVGFTFLPFPTDTCPVSHKEGTNKPDPGLLNSDSKAPHNDLYENGINRWLVSNTNNYITLRQHGPKWKHIVWSSAIEVTLPGHPFNARSSFCSLTPK